MPSSDSDEFESADENHDIVEKKERKKRLSSSNYSENSLEADQGPKLSSTKISNVEKPKSNVTEATDGWDDFDIDENEATVSKQNTENENNVKARPVSSSKQAVSELPQTKHNEKQDTGWDDFDDWGQEDFSNNKQKEQPPKSVDKIQSEQNIKSVTDRLAASTTSGGWGWGWNVDSLLSTATAGISTITSQVSQGISTVLETGIGAPDPEELARRTSKDNESGEGVKAVEMEKLETGETKEASSAPFPFGSLISGVTKFVETTGTKVIAGGLDTLETIGKKTMEVLQDGDPGLAKKRAMLGLDPGNKPVLSQVLREAKARADEEDKIREEKREAKEIHYENLFDDFEGLVHLEALEMLSRQVSMRIDERMRSVDPQKRQDIKETMQQVAELCEMPEDDDDEDEEVSAEAISKADLLHERLQAATQDLGLKLQFQPLVKQYTDTLEWLAGDEPSTEKAVYKRGVSSLAQATALSVEIYHKAAEMLLVKDRRSTADEADALTQMTVVLSKHISCLASHFTDKLNSVPTDNKDQVSTYITNVFLEAGNSSTYIQNAFQLTLPILQIGAV